MGRRVIISGKEKGSGVWVIRCAKETPATVGVVDWERKRESLARMPIATRDGTDLQPMFVAILRELGGNAPLADGMEALVVVPAVGYSVSETRQWAIEHDAGGKFSSSVVIRLSTGEDKPQPDFSRAHSQSMKSAIATVASMVGHPVFGTQILAS